MLTARGAFADFSLEGLFDRKLAVACPVAEDSWVELVIPQGSKTRFTIEPQQGMEIVTVDGQELARWDTKTGQSSSRFIRGVAGR